MFPSNVRNTIDIICNNFYNEGAFERSTDNEFCRLFPYVE